MQKLRLHWDLSLEADAHQEGTYLACWPRDGQHGLPAVGRHRRHLFAVMLQTVRQIRHLPACSLPWVLSTCEMKRWRCCCGWCVAANHLHTQVLLKYNGQDLGVLEVESKWVPNKAREVKECYRTSSLEHPGVQVRGAWRLTRALPMDRAGIVRGVMYGRLSQKHNRHVHADGGPGAREVLHRRQALGLRAAQAVRRQGQAARRHGLVVGPYRPRCRRLGVGQFRGRCHVC